MKGSSRPSRSAVRSRLAALALIAAGCHEGSPEDGSLECLPLEYDSGWHIFVHECDFDIQCAPDEICDGFLGNYCVTAPPCEDDADCDDCYICEQRPQLFPRNPFDSPAPGKKVCVLSLDTCDHLSASTSSTGTGGAAGGAGSGGMSTGGVNGTGGAAGSGGGS